MVRSLPLNCFKLSDPHIRMVFKFHIRFLFLAGLFAVYFSDYMFFELFFGKENPQIMAYNKILWIATFFASALFLVKMSRAMVYWWMGCTLAVLVLALESYYRYRHFFQYPHVFSKVLMLYSIFFVYGFYKTFADKLNIRMVVGLILVFFVANMAWVNAYAFSVSAFTANDRGLLATSVYLLIIPCLYFFNAYFKTQQIFHLYAFLGVLGLIIFFQHRTVWVSTLVALVVNIVLLKRTTYRITAPALLPLGLIGSVVGLLAMIIIFSNPLILEKLLKSWDDLMNPTTQGNGSWRWNQFVSYWPYVTRHYLLGMRFDGFELPVQFWDRDILAFEDGTGHHFHSTYLDKVFYLGLWGLALLFVPPIYLIAKGLSNLPLLTIDQVVMVAYVASVLAYGLSYNVNTHFYGSLGLALYFMESSAFTQKDIPNNRQKALATDYSTVTK